MYAHALFSFIFYMDRELWKQNIERWRGREIIKNKNKWMMINKKYFYYKWPTRIRYFRLFIIKKIRVQRGKKYCLLRK